MHPLAPALAVLLLAACGSADATGGGGLPEVPSSAGHLHGMAVDADGAVLLGTHVGTMRVTDDAVERIGDTTIDLMGFAADGDRLVASGHPGPGTDLPDPVGLVESTDGGATWQVLSRAGESDFHTLTASGGTVYGFDGRLRSTADGTTWTDLADDVLPASLAAHPSAPGTVLATTEHGPVRSTDDGRTFTHLDDAPLLVFLAWTAPDDVWAVAPDGTVHHSADAGTTWHRTGSAGGPPEAFTASTDGAVIVAVEDGIVRSTDDGATFTRIATRG